MIRLNKAHHIKNKESRAHVEENFVGKALVRFVRLVSARSGVLNL